LFFYVTLMHAYDRSILVGLISAPSSSFVMLHFVSITPVTGALCNNHGFIMILLIIRTSSVPDYRSFNFSNLKFDRSYYSNNLRKHNLERRE
jgi:hypothetical protein